MKVTSLSASRSFLFPTNTMTMLGLASVLASVSQLVRALYVSRLQGGYVGMIESGGEKEGERERNEREREREEEGKT